MEHILIEELPDGTRPFAPYDHENDVYILPLSALKP